MAIQISTFQLKDDAVTTAKIADGAVQSSQVADSAILAAKIASNAVTTDKINANAITSAKIASSAVLEAALASNAVTTAKINANAVTAAKIASGAVERAALASNVVGSTSGIELDTTDNFLKIKHDGSSLLSSSAGLRINTSGVSTTHIADNAISSAKLGSAVVTNAKLANLSVSDGKLQSNAVTTAKINNGAVTADKIDSSAVTSTKIASNAVGADKIDASTGTWDFSGVTAFRAPTPSESDDANSVVTLEYVSNIINGVAWKESCRVATTGNLSATYANGTNGVGATLTASSNGAIQIDGINLSADDRVLVKDQTTRTQNGIYEVTTVGDASNAFVLTRAADFNESGEMNGSAVFVYAGSTNADQGFVCTSDDVAIGTDDIQFSLFTGASAIANGSITTAKIADLAVTNQKLANLSVSAGKIQSNAVTTAKINNGAVTADKIDSSAVTTAKVADEAITHAKMAFVRAQEKISGTNALAYNLTDDVVSDDALQSILGFVNGVMAVAVEGSPADASEFTASRSGGTTTITFGGTAGDLNGEDLMFVYDIAKA